MSVRKDIAELFPIFDGSDALDDIEEMILVDEEADDDAR